MLKRRTLRLGVGTLLLATIVHADCPALLANGDFENGSLGWMFAEEEGFAYLSADVEADPFTVGNEYLHLSVDAYDSDPYFSDAIVSVEGFTIKSGSEYRLTFWAKTDDFAGDYDGETVIQVKVGQTQAPYSSLGLTETEFTILEGAGSSHEVTFTGSGVGTQAAGLVFLVGGEDADLWLDGVQIEEISAASCDGTGGSGGSGGAGGTGGGGTGGSGGGTGGSGNTGGVGGQIFSNQLGYVSTAEKVATYKSASTDAQAWELRDKDGEIVASGNTDISGSDAPSGDHVHLVDFSEHQTPGTGYRLWIGNAVSPSFEIGSDVYGRLRRDALRFFYHHRSGEAISATYSEGTSLARSAGHAYNTICTSASTCSYSLNTRSGWYDAGDYGKYVVNGGIALWTLLNLYERTEHLGTDLSALGDNKNNIPESGNGLSDLLDETKKEITFMLSMQVPDGEALAGMAHHKVHSSMWDAIPQAPATALTHYLRPPSTAATLNLAATAAQCARIFKSLDAPLAAKCLLAAEKAYAAAKTNPNRLAPASDDAGGGAYNDGDVSDEFYWAAAELFITTGDAEYESDMLTSEHHAAPPQSGDAMAWPTTAVLGMLSLGTVPSSLSDSELEAVRASLVTRAIGDEKRAAKGYGSSVENYYWGSNSSVLNAGLLQAFAYDLTGEAKHRAAALAALDYTLGRNPKGQSYVSGYGVAPFENAHHRFWANAFSGSSPKPPPGVLAGGPNQNLDAIEPADIISLGLSGCSPTKCWADYEDGFSLTEVTVNWNAPLAWLASWASEQENMPQTNFPGVDLEAAPGTGGSDGSGGSSGGDGDGGGDDTETGGNTGDGDGDGDVGGDGDGDVGGDGDNQSSNSGTTEEKGGCSLGASPGSVSLGWHWALLGLAGAAFFRRRSRTSRDC